MKTNQQRFDEIQERWAKFRDSPQSERIEKLSHTALIRLARSAADDISDLLSFVDEFLVRRAASEEERGFSNKKDV